jgi:signal peptidase II
MTGSKSPGKASQGLLTAFMILLLALLDQGSKYLAVCFLKDRNAIPLIPGVLKLYYLENRGIAFGLMQGRISVFLIFCLLFFAGAAYCFVRMPWTAYYRPVYGTLVVICGGALGNFLDRLFRGYVVDYIYFCLIDFPVFNLADIFVVCAGIVLIALMLFKYKDEDFAFLRPEK